MRRLNAAMNAHDIEAFLACFRGDYHSEQPPIPIERSTGASRCNAIGRRSSPEFSAVRRMTGDEEHGPR
jgi:hypothetical protein